MLVIIAGTKLLKNHRFSLFLWLDMAKETQLNINVAKILEQRLPRYWRFIPRWLVRGLERFIHQDEMNVLLGEIGELRGAEFCRALIDHLEVTCNVKGEEVLPKDEAGSRVVFVSNHPLGGLDGLALIDLLTCELGQTVYCVVNDLLLAVEPLRDVFLPINKHGRQSRDAGARLEEAFASNSPILMFPAGMCSRKGKDGTIADLEWKKMFVNHAIRYQRDIIPIYFSGENSRFFYNFASIRQKCGIRFNIEMTRLPAELFNCRGKCFEITLGERISYTSLRGGKEAGEQARLIKEIVYSLGNRS